MVEKFFTHRENYFTLQDMLDDIGHEIQKYRDYAHQGYIVETQITLLRMLKSDLRNIVKRYQKLESILNLKSE